MNTPTRTGIAATEPPEKLTAELNRIVTLELPHRHHIAAKDLHPESIRRILLSAYQRQPHNFEQLLGLSGVGAKTIRALSLIAELVYGVAPSYRDPVRYSFAHGGKDGIPYPVDRKTYDQSIELLSRAISRTKIGLQEKKEADNRLHRLGMGE